MSPKRRRIADPTLVAIAIALSLFGTAMVYSAGQTDVTTAVAKLYRLQIAWFLVGLGAAYAVSRASVRFLDWVTVPAYALSVFLLFLLLFVGAGAGTAASTKSWLAIGGVRLGQPSELAKIAVVLMLARVLAARQSSLYEKTASRPAPAGISSVKIRAPQSVSEMSLVILKPCFRAIS